MEDISQSNTNAQQDTPIPNDDTTKVVQDAEIIEQATNPEGLDSMWLRWKCLNCGYLYEGVKEVKKCPRCGNENPDLFSDAD
ncbi:MAG: hypothetical protein UR61_C0014G0004 [candidate division WS6 bacterium GW2011_GWE1_34_7]|uniref:Rubredoxin-like domain-containing protein n=1 Tax=candidate division WS6 bacterium GW2011_GWE1_34_7 TaxID=1619093 RepID=A0A0G0B8I9_9BACT|nr:MAG: hypothetical protein UR61_C0014G0004 [candidate division WS6 bacterium GW2011_GWE1_34_7]